MTIPNDLRPGMVLGFKGEAIVRWKTDGLAGHVAVYIGNGNVVTALTNHGVGQYPLSIQGELVWVRQPANSFDLDKAMAWLNTVSGAKYGWNDIANVAGFTVHQSGNNEMDCSDTSAHFLEAGGCPQFDLTYDKGSITPRDFETSIQSTRLM